MMLLYLLCTTLLRLGTLRTCRQIMMRKLGDSKNGARVTRRILLFSASSRDCTKPARTNVLEKASPQGPDGSSHTDDVMLPPWFGFGFDLFRPGSALCCRLPSSAKTTHLW
ncbi:hypothetical protein B0I35DRAFT_126926 [Stachybotrys elegans]|uniref:Secreted protein n=1 Tax=Stachybotrys elegans TaxID=80388 RepID=A0A8K0SYN4_9HYPO|nr:hypothetical protein B0I35DRAFT_126926 [Stachybotrys elegans]